MNIEIELNSLEDTFDSIKKSNMDKVAKQYSIMGLVEVMTNGIESGSIDHDSAKPLSAKMIQFLIVNMCNTVSDALKEVS